MLAMCLNLLNLYRYMTDFVVVPNKYYMRGHCVVGPYMTFPIKACFRPLHLMLRSATVVNDIICIYSDSIVSCVVFAS